MNLNQYEQPNRMPDWMNDLVVAIQLMMASLLFTVIIFAIHVFEKGTTVWRKVLGKLTR